jgi:hypothetical protein
MSVSRLHSINESRRQFGNIGRDTIYSLLNSGQLQAKKIGRRTLVTDESLRNYIRNLPPFPTQSRAEHDIFQNASGLEMKPKKLREVKRAE